MDKHTIITIYIICLCAATSIMAQKRAHAESPAALPEVFQSPRIDEQTSSFIGAFSPSLSATALQRLPDFRTATHRIAAWRKPSRQKSLTPTKSLFETGHDDDGESWAGGRIARVLNDTQAVGTVVVARWYGGQNIGPIRFAHIESCAKEAIWKWKVAMEEREREEARKKQRVDDEARRGELVEELAQRDYNIAMLRKLLAKKKAKLSGEEVGPATPQKKMEYGKMGVEVLKRLDKARDATIAAILKQMDKVDEDLKLLDGLDDDALDEYGETAPPGGAAAIAPARDLEASNEEATTTRRTTKEALNHLEEELRESDKQDDDQAATGKDVTSTG